MNAERILVAQNASATAAGSSKKAIDYAKERVVFGRPIGKNQGVQFPIARAYAELEAADMMCRRAAALFDAGKACGADANMAKLLASEAAWHAAEACMQTMAGSPMRREYDIERKWREMRLYQIAPISTNMMLAYIGQHVLGHAAVVLSGQRKEGGRAPVKRRPAGLSGAGDAVSRGGRFWPARHSFSFASRLAFDSAVKSGKARCAWIAHLSIDFHLVIAVAACELRACAAAGRNTIASSAPIVASGADIERRRGSAIGAPLL